VPDSAAWHDRACGSSVGDSASFWPTTMAGGSAYSRPIPVDCVVGSTRHTVTNYDAIRHVYVRAKQHRYQSAIIPSMLWAVYRVSASDSITVNCVCGGLVDRSATTPDPRVTRGIGNRVRRACPFIFQPTGRYAIFRGTVEHIRSFK
jgi:hypothetical protein